MYDFKETKPSDATSDTDADMVDPMIEKASRPSTANNSIEEDLWAPYEDEAEDIEDFV